MAATHSKPKGRPKGIVTTATQQRVRVANRLLAQSPVLPLDVMIKTMELIYREGESILKDSQSAANADERLDLRHRGIARLKDACEVAKDAAPYLHGRMNTVTLKNDEAGPLMVKLVSDTNELLKKLQGDGNG